MKSCKECGADLLDINETFANESYIYECEECGRWFTEDDIEGDFSTKVFAGIISAGFKAETERDDLTVKIKAFFEAFKVGPHPVNEGQIDMVAYDDYGGNPVFWEHAGESDEDIARRVALWNLWNAVNSKSE